MSSIDHAFIDLYEGVAGELERLPKVARPPAAVWEAADELLLDLHMMRHGYTTDSYDRHVERRLKELCAGEDVVERMKALRI